MKYLKWYKWQRMLYGHYQGKLVRNCWASVKFRSLLYDHIWTLQLHLQLNCSINIVDVATQLNVSGKVRWLLPTLAVVPQ